MISLTKDGKNCLNDFETHLRGQTDGLILIVNKKEDLTTNFTLFDGEDSINTFRNMFDIKTNIVFEELPCFYDDESESLVFKYKDVNLIIIRDSFLSDILPKEGGLYTVIRAKFRKLKRKAIEMRKTKKMNKVKL